MYTPSTFACASQKQGRHYHTMSLFNAAFPSPVMGEQHEKPASTVAGSEPTLDESLESLSSSYQGYYKSLPDQVWSSPHRDGNADDSSDAPSPTPTASSPSSVNKPQSSPLSEEDQHVSVTGNAEDPKTFRDDAILSPKTNKNGRPFLVPFGACNAGVPIKGNAVLHLQHELKFARQEIRELRQLVECQKDATSVAAVVLLEGSSTGSNASVPPEILVQGGGGQDEVALWNRLEETEKRATKLAKQLRESNVMAAKLYRSLKIAQVRLVTLNQLRQIQEPDMGLIVQQSQWLRGCMLVCPVLLLCGHVEIFAVLVALSWVTVEVSTGC